MYNNRGQFFLRTKEMFLTNAFWNMSCEKGDYHPFVRFLRILNADWNGQALYQGYTSHI
jgi:hypothetical protein